MCVDWKIIRVEPFSSPQTSAEGSPGLSGRFPHMPLAPIRTCLPSQVDSKLRSGYLKVSYAVQDARSLTHRGAGPAHSPSADAD